MARLRLGGRREDRLRQFLALLQACRQPDTADRPLLPILFPARARDVAARYALDLDHPGALHEHGAAFELIAEGSERLGILIHVRRQEMSRRDVAQEIEPEDR